MKVLNAYRDVSQFISDASKAAKFALEHLSCSITVRNEAEIRCVILWLQEHSSIAKSKNVIRRKIDDNKGIVFVPTQKPFFFRFNGCPMAVAVKSDAEMTLFCIGRNNQPIKKLIEEAKGSYTLAKKDVLTLFTHKEYGSWNSGTALQPRPRDSVILPSHEMDAILGDVAAFLASEEKYLRIGVPYRRGYLFHGPPGTGKSSTGIVIASELKMQICVFNLATLSDTNLAEAMGNITKRSIILMEDIDRSRKEGEKGEWKSTASGLLNVLDGVLAPTGSIIVMTTNHKDKLDPALIRPGRVDFQHEFKNLDTEGARLMCLRFFPDDEDKARRFAATVRGREISPALAQSMLLANAEECNPETPPLHLRKRN